PAPVRDLGRIDPVGADELSVRGEARLVLPDELLCAGGDGRVAPRHLLRGLDDDVVPAGAVADLHVEWCRGRPLFPVAVDVEPIVVSPLPDKLLDGGRVAVEVEDDGDAARED